MSQCLLSRRPLEIGLLGRICTNNIFLKLVCFRHIKQNTLTFLSRICTPYLSESPVIFGWAWIHLNWVSRMKFFYDKATSEKKLSFVLNHSKFRPNDLFQVYHVTHMHKKSPKEFLSNFTRTKFVKNCQKCMKKCFTPMVLALHHDRHHLVKPYECPNCLKSYLSPAAYYKEDFCRKNALPGFRVSP